MLDQFPGESNHHLLQEDIESGKTVKIIVLDQSIKTHTTITTKAMQRVLTSVTSHSLALVFLMVIFIISKVSFPQSMERRIQLNNQLPDFTGDFKIANLYSCWDSKHSCIRNPTLSKQTRQKVLVLLLNFTEVLSDSYEEQHGEH